MSTAFLDDEPERDAAGARIFVLNLGTILRLIAGHRLQFASPIAVFLILAIVFLNVAPHRYSVSMQLAPVASEANGLAGRLGSLGSLAGLGLGQDMGLQDFRLFREGLQSRAAADSIAQNAPLMHRLFTAQWSNAEGAWREPQSVTRPISAFLRSMLGVPFSAWAPPNGEDVYQILQRELSIADDPRSPVLTVTTQLADPETGSMLLLALHEIVDGKLRRRSLERADQYIAYLTQQLNRITVADYRQALVDNIALQEKNRMVASAGASFAADVFSGPNVSRFPTSPNIPLVLGFALVLGIVIGLMLAARTEWRRHWLLHSAS